MAGDIKKNRLTDEALEHELIKMFECGIMSKNDCYEELRKKYQIMTQRVYLMHPVVHSKWFESKEKTRVELTTQVEQDRLKRAILSKSEALEILSKTAKGTASKVGEQIIVPTFSERTNAIKTIAELEGWQAPKQLNVKLGKDIEETFE